MSPLNLYAFVSADDLGPTSLAHAPGGAAVRMRRQRGGSGAGERPSDA